MASFQHLIESLLGMLFPERCAGCGRLGAILCERCRNALVIYPSTFRVDHLDAVSIAYVYQNPVRACVHQLKYHRQKRVATPLGELLTMVIKPHASAIDALLPVPIHAARRAERGFNQTELLAHVAAGKLGIPTINNGLARVRATSQQIKLNAHERRDNMQGAFAWQAKTPPPPRVMLLDDVLTTGATMSACAQALREAGCREVYGVALARSKPDLR